MDLFEHGRREQIEQESPLANRMRPRTLDEFVGQEHIVGPGRLLRRAIQADQLSSLIFYGPPGTGKTTLAMIIANTTESYFITINAVLAGVAQIRESIKEARERRNLYGQRTTLFVDEVHRWNKAQQDALLPHVENGTIIMIGATTENPYFEVNKALVSRSRIFQLKPLKPEDLYLIARRVITEPDIGYGKLKVNLTEDALDHLVDVANGDARGVLNALELAIETTPPNEDGVIVVNLGVAEESIQKRAVLYDKEGDVHYDTVSAFIKSMRGSDPDAALYWLAKMVYAGEDPRFIFRRMAILASEDVGLADPNAAVVVASCWDLFERIGLPEGRFHLAQAALYLSTCNKSNSTMGFFDALGAVEAEQEEDVPNHLKDANRDAQGFGHGEGYLYPHAYRDHWVGQQYLPDSLQGKVFYDPSDQGYERGIKEEVSRRREEQLAAMLEMDTTVPEGLTTGPADRARDAWLQRAIANSGRNLGHIREKIFELASVRRHHLVLDLKADSGLLTWEAVRAAPEGGVWAFTQDPHTGEALRQQASRLPEIERPVVLIGSVQDLDQIMELRGESEIQFDRILGRGVFTRNEGWDQILDQTASKLRSGGRIVLAQIVPRHSQRLYKLCDWTAAADALLEKVRDGEEAIYKQADDILVNWDAEELAKVLKKAGFSDIEFSTEPQLEHRRITEAHIERWFSDDAAAALNGKLSYSMRLAEVGLNEDEIGEVRALYSSQLRNQVVQWGGQIAYLVGHK
ncbi:MAG: AAA family ATPase [Candidatus Promineifilaceae bacterium]